MGNYTSNIGKARLGASRLPEPGEDGLVHIHLHTGQHVCTNDCATSRCPEWQQRAQMTDDEFWAHVLRQDDDEYDPHDDYGHDLDVAMGSPPCTTCGSTTACAYDSEGRALIHAEESDDAGEG